MKLEYGEYELIEFEREKSNLTQGKTYIKEDIKESDMRKSIDPIKHNFGFTL